MCYCAWVYVWLNLCSAHTVGARGVRGVATIFRSANNERLELSNSTDGSDRPMFPKSYIFNESVRRFILQPTVKGEQISKDKLLFWSSFRELNKGRWMRNAVRRMLLLSLSLSFQTPNFHYTETGWVGFGGKRATRMMLILPPLKLRSEWLIIFVDHKFLFG